MSRRLAISSPGRRLLLQGTVHPRALLPALAFALFCAHLPANVFAGGPSGTLSWTPPTENEDGTPLMDLAGYRVYWGQSPGTYEFVATSLNGAGVESRFSNAITKIVQ